MNQRPLEDPLTFETVRKLAIIAMFSDDLLMERLVLKGGNALSLVLQISPRVSLDLDFSLAEDFPDVAEAARRIEHALKDRFDSAGYVIFDYRFLPIGERNAERGHEWGGYQVEFKVMRKAAYHTMQDPQRRSREAAVVSPGQQRIFKIQISKHEYCEAKEPREVDGYTIFVYTPAAIVIEKLRALCQQLPDYDLIPAPMKRPRARDYYDIYTVMTRKNIALTTPENLALLREVFAIKQVPLRLLGKLDENRGYHEVGHSAVQDTVSAEVMPFAFYADYVRDLALDLQPLWDE